MYTDSNGNFCIGIDTYPGSYKEHPEIQKSKAFAEARCQGLKYYRHEIFPGQIQILRFSNEEGFGSEIPQVNYEDQAMDYSKANDIIEGFFNVTPAQDFKISENAFNNLKEAVRFYQEELAYGQ